MRHMLIVLPALLLHPQLHAQTAADTAAMVASIEKFMMKVDRFPIARTYAMMPVEARAQRLETGAPMPPGALELIELYVDSNARVVGVSVFKPELSEGIQLSASYYFHPDGNLVAVQHVMRWRNSNCAHGHAVQRDFQYFNMPRKIFFEYTTLTDSEGNNVDPSRCIFPKIDRQPEMYPHLDMLLLSKRIVVAP